MGGRSVYQIKQSLLYLEQVDDEEIQKAVAAHTKTLEDMWKSCKTEEVQRIFPSIHHQVTTTLTNMGATVSTGELS